MIRKRLLVTGLAMSMCLNQMPPTVLVKASQNTNSNSKFEVEVKNSKASKYGYIKPAGQSYATAHCRNAEKSDAPAEPSHTSCGKPQSESARYEGKRRQASPQGTPAGQESS